MECQRVIVDGRSLPLNLQSIRFRSIAEMTNGHSEIVVHFTADISTTAQNPHTITCMNGYEPIPSTYQSNGLVPKAPGVHVDQQRRDELQKELQDLLKAQFGMRMQHATQQLANTSQIKKVRRDIARARTVIKEKAAK